MKKHVWNKVVTAFIAIIILLVISLALPCRPAQAAEPAPNYWGVFVGVSTYATNPDLIYAVDDASELYEIFSPVWGDSHTKLLIDSGATKTRIFEVITWLAQNVRENDTVIFTFSGMGVSPGAICPTDFEAVYGGITTTQLADAFAAVKAKNLIFVLDCDYAGKFRVSMSKPGRILMFSCTEQETHKESSVYRHGYFTYFLLQALHDFIDYNTEQKYDVTAEEIGIYAQQNTLGVINSQHPIVEDKVNGDLPLINKFNFALNTNLPSGTTVLTLDNVGYLSPPNTQFWIPGSTHTMTVPDIVNVGSGTRYIFTNWNDGSSLTERKVSKGSYTANYELLYRLTVNSPYGEVTGTGWYNSGSSANFSVTPSVVTSDTRRYFTVWSGDVTGAAPTGSLTMDSPKVISANWRTEFLLTLNSEYGATSGSGWYNAWAKANISVETGEGFLIRQIFDGWSGGFSGTEASAEVTMDSPKAITAVWHTDYYWLYIIIAIAIIVVGGTPAAIFLYMHISHKRSQPTPVPVIKPAAKPAVKPRVRPRAKTAPPPSKKTRRYR